MGLVRRLFLISLAAAVATLGGCTRVQVRNSIQKSGGGFFDNYVSYTDLRDPRATTSFTNYGIDGTWDRVTIERLNLTGGGTLTQRIDLVYYPPEARKLGSIPTGRVGWPDKPALNIGVDSQEGKYWITRAGEAMAVYGD